MTTPLRAYRFLSMNRLTLLALALLVTLVACHKTTPDQIDNDKQLYEIGLKSFNNKDYTDAITYFESLKNRFPLSPFALDSELKIADAHFEKGEYLEAALAYQSFKTLHPASDKIPYVIYQTGYCYYKDSPKAIDRDQANLEKTIHTLAELQNKWPASKEAEKAAPIIAKCKTALLKRDIYVSKFYIRQKRFDAALSRLTSSRSQLEFAELADEAHFLTAKIQLKLKNRTAAEEALKPVLGNKESTFYTKAKKLIEQN